MSANWSEKTWREHIENRRKNSAIWQFIHLCGSMRLAMIELFTILAACAIATICESRFDSHVAQAYIYKSQWFFFWLLVLCINLFCVTLTRWPWRPRHRGFVITHYGIILLLVGAAVGQKLGFEANITLRVGGGASRDLIINQTVLQVQGGNDPMYRIIPIDVKVRTPSPDRPQEFSVPGARARLRVENYAMLSETPELVDSPFPNVGAGVALEFSSGMMSRSVPVVLAQKPEEASHNTFFGRAQIEWLAALPDRSGAPPEDRSVEETQVVFARGTPPVIATRKGQPTGYRLALQMQGGLPQIVVEAPASMPTPHGPAAPHRQVFALSKVLGQPITLEGETIHVLVREYWPDMEMKEGHPVSKSTAPNNPAMLVMLTGEGRGAKPLLELAPAEGGGIGYQMSRGGAVVSHGEVAVGESFPLGWADWKAKVVQALPNAMIHSRLAPLPEKEGKEGSMPAAAQEEGTPGIYARLVNPAGEKKEGEAQWVPSGRGVMLRAGEENAFVGFGLHVYKVPFTLELLKFEVPRDPGTQNPSDFRSSIRFTDTATGRTRDAVIHMNHPASFPEGFWRAALGRNFKFSQAQWNAHDLNETTLQVLHDPGWPFKWIGSLAVCGGIAIMFYGKPGSGKRRALARAEEKSAGKRHKEKTEETNRNA